MILIDKGYFKVWKVEPKENFTALDCSTSDKQTDGTYKNSNWKVRLVGKSKGLDVAEGDTLVIKSAKIENIWDKVKKCNWLNVIVFDAEVKGNGEKQEKSTTVKSDDELPF